MKIFEVETNFVLKLQKKVSYYVNQLEKIMFVLQRKVDDAILDGKKPF